MGDHSCYDAVFSILPVGRKLGNVRDKKTSRPAFPSSVSTVCLPSSFVSPSLHIIMASLLLGRVCFLLLLAPFG